MMSMVLGFASGSILNSPCTSLPATNDAKLLSLQDQGVFFESLFRYFFATDLDLDETPGRLEPLQLSSSIALALSLTIVFDRFQTTSSRPESTGAAKSVGRASISVRPRQIVRSSPASL